MRDLTVVNVKDIPEDLQYDLLISCCPLGAEEDLLKSRCERSTPI